MSHPTPNTPQNKKEKKKKSHRFKSECLIDSILSLTYLIRMLRIQVLHKLALIQKLQNWWKPFWRQKFLSLLEDLIEFKKNPTQTHSLLLIYEGLQNRNAVGRVVSSNKRIQTQQSTSFIRDIHGHRNATFIFQTKDIWLQKIVARRLLFIQSF